MNTKTTQYNRWRGMFRRCYWDNGNIRSRRYADCEVCDEWKSFEVFEQWFYENYYEIPGEKMSLDKDIIKKNNKIYCPDYCIFAPERINMLFTKSNSIRGQYPIGVSSTKENKYRAQMTKRGKIRKHLGEFDNIEDAFKAYKLAKETYIKEIADEYMSRYSDVFPRRLYDAMYAYEVDIND